MMDKTKKSKSIRDIILEDSLKKQKSSTVTQIGGKTMDSKQPPSSRSSSKKKVPFSDDILNILKKIDKSKISGKRGRGFYSADDLMKYLGELGKPTNGSKEALSQRLLDIFRDYGM
jgi:hypothetical protein